jgi:hypothetical protein
MDITRRLHSTSISGTIGNIQRARVSPWYSGIFVITTLLSSLQERPDHHYSTGSKQNTRNHTRKSPTFLFWVIPVSAPTLYFDLPGVGYARRD